MKALPTTTIEIPVNQINERIVAEICAHWQYGRLVGKAEERKLISSQFEKVIAFNQSRGYQLESWQLTSLLEHTEDPPTIMIETIVAVFKRDHSFKPTNQ